MQTATITDPLAVIQLHIRKLATSARNARRVGIPELAATRRVQIMALNDVRRSLLGRMGSPAVAS